MNAGPSLKRFSRLPLHATVIGLLVSGCVTAPKLGPQPQIQNPQSFAAERSLSQSSNPAKASPWPDGGWWRGYGDPQLTALVEEALANAPDVAAAAARLNRADGYQQLAGAALLPRIDGQASVDKTKESYNNGIPAAFVPHGWNGTASAALDANFDLDLWGRNRANLRAATSDAEALSLDLSQARLLISTNIANAYANLARQFAERDVEENAVALRVDTQKLVADRVEIGVDTKAELKQADAAVLAEQAQLAQIDEQIGLARNQIAALLGKGPDRGLSIQRPALSFTARTVPADVTTDLIGRRPDIVSARARVEASAQRIKVARSDFYPSVSVTAMIGSQALGIPNWFKSGSSYGQVGPAISLPIFHGGEIAGNYRVARATYDEAVASYDGTVVAAFHDVADAVTSQAMLSPELDLSQKSLAAAQEAYSIARQRYEGGLSNYLSVLSAQDGVLREQRIVVDLEARGFSLEIALVRALGGGAVPITSTTADRGNASKETPNG